MTKKKIMVIDDEEDFLRITKLNLLETGQYEVLTLSNAKDIVNQFKTFRPDVVMMDMLMPGMGGIEACELLNKDPEGKKVPIIILSALEKEEDKKKAFMVGVVDYLVKPADKEILIAKLQKALRYK